VTGLQGAVANPLSPQVEYRRGPDMGGGIGGLLHSLRDGAPKYNLGNGRGDVVAQSDQSGALTWTASYEAFGTRPLETGNNADRQRANTKEEDPTGLLWEHFRYRDLETGVWLSRDPAGFVDGPNLYAYVNQNPWTKFDPLGLESNHAALEEAYQQQPKAIRWLVRGMVNALKTADDHMDRNEAAGNGRTMTAGQTAGVMLEGTATDLSIVTVAAAAPAGIAALGKEVVGEATGIPTNLGDLAKLARNAPEGVADITKSARKQADETTEQVTRQTSSGFGVTEHGVQQKINREVRSADELQALKDPLKVGEVKIDSKGRPSQRYVGEKAETVINPETKKIVSVNPTSSKKAERLKKQRKDGE
jgi:RHS repeat-associated protein